jgi:hypothetical protein
MLPSEVFRWCTPRVRFRHAPIEATKALFDGDRIGVNTTTLQADEFTDSQACPHGDVDHRGVRLGSQLEQIVELLGRDVGFGCYRLSVYVNRGPKHVSQLITLVE